jgi:cell division protein FtsA
MVGKKLANGAISVLAKETEDAGGCIRRGSVYNVEETAHRISRLALKLQNKLSDKLPDFRIEKIYIGVGGQSLRSIEHSEVKILPADAVISDEDLRMLDAQCHTYKPEMLDVLGSSPPVYYVDDKPADHPVGIPGKRIEARYKLIVGRPSIRNLIENSIKRTNVSLAGIIVSPQALADVLFTPDEKELGCALINFGAGVTSIVVYRGGTLIHLSVIPLGGRLITKDLTSLPLVESEAERLKTTHGSALINKEKEDAVIEIAGRKVDPNEINVIIEARAREIVDNVYARVKTTCEIDSLGSGVILAGGAAALKNLPELVRQCFRQDVRYSNIRKEWIDGDEESAGNPDYMTAVSLLIRGTENCASYYVAPPPPNLPDPPEDDKTGGEIGGDDTETGGTGIGSDTGTGDNRTRRRRKSNLIDRFMKDLFKAD